MWNTVYKTIGTENKKVEQATQQQTVREMINISVEKEKLCNQF